ncbi:MAG: class I SAM-dependent methyltransferase [Bacteroidetes bacterium]|nr:class I SAM-dependent methyltransferase [Bacteroidota bacterium]
MMIYVNIALVLVFLFIFGRYLYSLYIEGHYRPEEWAYYIKSGTISHELQKAFRQYKDKVRFFSWWLQVERIRREKVEGSFAELGVYQGDSAYVLHLMDPDRRFHLFDTFGGFEGSDLHLETGEAATYTINHFADTSVERVRQKLGSSRSLVFHEGYFPDTTAGLEKSTFALVNIDADLYQPIKAGLQFFYPRLSRGGAIFIHDYNYKWEGCRKAVDEFLETIPEHLFFLPDKDGTVLIIKA